MPAQIRCGFIGLGSQGGGMARQIARAGFPLTLWARRPEALEPFRDTGARFAGSVAELGAAAEHVGVCVVDDAGVTEVCNGLIASMAPGGRIVVHSTVHPDTCKALAASAAARGLALIDAPVSGGGAGAEARTLTVMVGGDPQAVAAAWPVFETFAGLAVHLGGVGAGQLAKLINNGLMAANLAMVDHAMAAGDALGIGRAALAQLLKVSSGRSYALDIYASLPTPAAFLHGAKLLEKDVRLLADVLGPETAGGALERAARGYLDGVKAAAAEPGKDRR